MGNWLLLTIAGLLLALGVFALGVAWLAPAAGMGARLRRMLGEEVAEPAPRAKLATAFEAVLTPAARLLPASAQDASRLRRWLAQAGLREPKYVTLFFGLRTTLALAVPALGLLAGLGRRAPLLLMLGALLGWTLPRFLLKKRAAARARRIRLSLPDTLDLMVICVEAGLGLDQALQRVAPELKVMHPDLCSELELVMLEMRAGAPRSEALRHLAQRSSVDDLRALAAVLIQTDRFGTSVSQALRVHSDSLRVERRQRAEEAAAKLSIKMLPVLALFIFPAVMIVVIGPAVLALIRNLGPALGH
jgi:tight adherence protein C